MLKRSLTNYSKLSIAALVAVTFPIATVASIVGTAYYGWALSILWGWFVVPIFHLPSISIVQAMGLSLPVILLRIPTWDTDSSKLLGYTLFSPLSTLLVGYIIKHWLM